MPISLPPISRRRFLAGSVAAGAAFLTGCAHQKSPSDQLGADPNRFALLSDTHIPADKAYVHKTGAIPWKNFEQASAEIRALSPRPSAVLVNGDCACLKGLPGDYASLSEAIDPLREHGLPVHLGVGNHDNRNEMWKAFPKDASRRRELDRNLVVVSAPNANWFILDSLEETDKTPGLLGPEQLAWLARQLDARADKPALVMVHHDPGKNALKDVDALYQVIMPRKQVKAYIFGHTHVWKHSTQDGLHLINLPTNAWLFDARQPNGWTDCMLRPDGATFQLHALKADHPQNGEKLELAWR